MVRRGQIERTVDLDRVEQQVYRPDIYRAAASALSIAVHDIEYKDEGNHREPWVLSDGSSRIPLGPDLFIDGRVFDPGQFARYLDGFKDSCAIAENPAKLRRAIPGLPHECMPSLIL